MTDPQADLARAEERAGVRVRVLTEVSELLDAQYVFDAVWPPAGGGTQVASNMMRAIVHAGGYACAAYRDGQPIGAALGFVGRHRAHGQWHEHLHSHMAAVLDPYRDQHIGSALKIHQRAWALAEGIDSVVWTFDPLVRRNARMNLIKLGVDVDGFEVDFYGPMDDGINSGDPTDRLFAWWRVGSARVDAAMRGELGELDVDALAAQGRDVVMLELPDDIVALRAEDPAAAQEWRVRMRERLISAFAEGYRVVGFATAGGYALERTT